MCIYFYSRLLRDYIYSSGALGPSKYGGSYQQNKITLWHSFIFAIFTVIENKLRFSDLEQ
jgi:hypothetical protein